MKRNMPWLKMCKACGKFTGKDGKHPNGPCESGFKGKGHLYIKQSILKSALFPEEEFPLTSPYLANARDIAFLVMGKQKAYGDSFGKSGNILKELYPAGIMPHQYGDALTVVRIIDKLFSIATKKNAYGESPWKDIMGYALLAATKDKRSDTGSK